MTATAKILEHNGYANEVEYAAMYAMLRARAMWSRLPIPQIAPPCPAAAKLFKAIDKCNDAQTLEEFAWDIQPECLTWGDAA